ncbi:MAG: hypothetical protein R3190_13165, partial [Thermoanaerobaculia bacterium]|nr:hypothetical protein [Thermoanaerobaculia bacterium]
MPIGEPGDPGAEGATGGIPWQQREELGAAAALLQTLKLFTLSPARAFARVQPGQGLWGPLLFGVVVGSLALLLNILGAALFGSIAIFDPPAELQELFGLTVAGHSVEWIPLLLALAT